MTSYANGLVKPKQLQQKAVPVHTEGPFQPVGENQA